MYYSYEIKLGVVLLEENNQPCSGVIIEGLAIEVCGGVFFLYSNFPLTLTIDLFVKERHFYPFIVTKLVVNYISIKIIIPN